MNHPAQQLCLECGLCCNGTIFAKGQLQPEDDTEKLRALGLRLISPRRSATLSRKPPKFSQPCAALDGCRCTIYAERPSYCRQFRCTLLQAVEAGGLATEEAQEIVRKTRNQAAKVDRWLRRLGDTDELTALSLRFRRMSKRLNGAPVDAVIARNFGDLTVAMHRLNVLLCQHFFAHEL